MFQHLKDGLATQGWFDAGRQHRPVRCVSDAMDETEQIVPNLIAMSSESSSGTDLEMGSGATVETIDYWFDIYAESDALGRQISGDIRAIFQGHFAGNPVVDVFDWSLATPSRIFSVEVVDTDRSRNRNHVIATAPARHWWTALVVIEDARGE